MQVLAGRGLNLAKHIYESKINLAKGGPDFASFAKFGDKIDNLATLKFARRGTLFGFSPVLVCHLPLPVCHCQLLVATSRGDGESMRVVQLLSFISYLVKIKTFIQL